MGEPGGARGGESRMAGTQSQPRVNLVRPRRGEDDYLAAVPESVPDTAHEHHSGQPGTATPHGGGGAAVVEIGCRRCGDDRHRLGPAHLVLGGGGGHSRWCWSRSTTPGGRSPGRDCRTSAGSSARWRFPLPCWLSRPRPALIEPAVLQDTTAMVAGATGARRARHRGPSAGLGPGAGHGRRQRREPSPGLRPSGPAASASRSWARCGCRCRARTRTPRPSRSACRW